MSRLFLLKSYLKNNMQSFAKCSNRYFVSSFRHSLHYGPKQKSLLEKQAQKLCNYEGYRMFHPVSRYDLKQVRKEYHAVRSLLLRSGWSKIPRISRLSDIRALSTSATNASNKHGGNPSNDPPKKDEEDPKKDEWDGDKLLAFLVKAIIWTFFVYFLFASTMILLRRNNYPNEISRLVSWNEFVHHMLAKGEVEELIIKPEVDMIVVVLHDGAVIKGRRSDHKYYQMVVADVMQFEEKLRDTERNLGIKLDQRVPVIYERKDYIFGYVLTTLIMIMIMLMFFSRSRKWPNPMTFLSQMTRAKFTLVDPLTGTGKGVRFDDVAGLQEAKVEVMEFVDYLKRPQHYKTLGAKVPRGALLLGPPGCGKTLLAKAVATEANVPFLSMNGSEFIEMIGGLGAARMRSLFKEGRSRSPAIIYIDEIDAIGKKRSDSKGAQYDGGSGESEQTLNQLLVEMDGMASKDGVIVLASTNRAEVLDQALLRPGRFDRHILIDLPTLEERRQIFEQHLKGITLERNPQYYSKMLAHLTPGFSGADIANVCNEAALHAARYKKKLVDGNDLSYAVDRVVGGTEKRDHAMSPAERRVVAYHESGHALVGWLLEHTDALLKVTIVPRTNLALGFAQYVPTDQKLYTREQLFERMCMMLGGRVAESLTFNKISTGAQNDLEKVTKIAYAQIQQYGMDPTVGLLSFDQEQTSTKTKKPYSKQMASLMDEEARRLIVRVYQNTEKVLSENKDKLQLLAEALLKKETLKYDDVVKLIGPPPHGKKRLIEPADFESSVKAADIPSAQPAPA